MEFERHNDIPVLFGRCAVILVDQQTGSPIPCEEYETSLQNTIPLLTKAREAGIPIIHLQEFHRKELVDFGRELDGVEPVHCLEGTSEVELYPPLAPIDGEWLIQKRRYSGFFGTDLDLLLRDLKIDTVILTGTITNVCVHYTAIDAHQYGYVVRVAADCVAGTSKRAHEASLEAIEYHQFGAIRDSHEIIAGLEERMMQSDGPFTEWRVPSIDALMDKRWYVQQKVNA